VKAGLTFSQAVAWYILRQESKQFSSDIKSTFLYVCIIGDIVAPTSLASGAGKYLVQLEQKKTVCREQNLITGKIVKLESKGW